MTDEATGRDELRELLFDGVAPPADSAAMFDRTFAATGADGADLLPPEDLFDEPTGSDPIVDEPVDLYTDDPGLDDATDTADDGAPDWDSTPEPAHDPGDTGDTAAVDHHAVDHHDW